MTMSYDAVVTQTLTVPRGRGGPRRVRSFQVSDREWQRAQDLADLFDCTTSEVVRIALTLYLDKMDRHHADGFTPDAS